MNHASRRSALVACLVTIATGAAAATASAAEPPCRQLVRFNPLNFPATPAVTNTRLPLIPGWQRVYEGRSNVNGQALPHQVTFTVTDLTKVIAGVRTVVVHDVDYSSGLLAEQELSFWAQDNQGNVWNLGEYPEEWINGVQLKGAPSTWMAGLDGAVPGIHMPVRLPEPGEDPYLQGYVPKINFLDCATTFQTGTTACVPVGCFRGVVVNDETSPLDPGSGSQRKSYAAGVGIIDIGFVDDPQGERLVLTQNAQLGPDALAAVRNAVLVMDARGYNVNPSYRRSVPIESPVAAPAAVTPTAPIAEAPFQEAPAPKRPTTGRVSLSLHAGAQRVSPSWEAAVRVVCATPVNRVTIRPGACRGALDLTVRGTGDLAGSAPFSVPGGERRTVRLALTSRARQLLRSRHHLPVVVRTRGARAADRLVVARLSLTLSAPG